MAQQGFAGSLNSQCSNPVNLYLHETDGVRPDRSWPINDGDVVNSGNYISVLLTTGVGENVPHVPECAQSMRLTHASNYESSSNPPCGSIFIPSIGIGRGFGCRQITPATIETRTIAMTDSGETRVSWSGLLKPLRLQCLEPVPLTVGIGDEKQSFTFWLKNDYVIRKRRWAKCSAKDLELSSTLKSSPF